VNTKDQRIAIVTGAARGIGAATAIRLAKDGNAVAVLDMDATACAQTVSAITSAGGRAIAVAADVSSPEGVDAAVAQVVAELGVPTILVNNAGIIRDNLIFKMPLEDWDAVMNVHLRGAFLMTRAVQVHMTAENYGGSSTCPPRPRRATAVRSTTRPPRRACRVSPRPWRSNSAPSA